MKKTIIVSVLFVFVVLYSYAIYKKHFSNELLVSADLADVEMIPAGEEIQPQILTKPAGPIKRHAVTAALKNNVPAIGFKQIVPEPQFKNLSMIGKVGRNGVDDEDG